MMVKTYSYKAVKTCCVQSVVSITNINSSNNSSNNSFNNSFSNKYNLQPVFEHKTLSVFFLLLLFLFTLGMELSGESGT